MASLIAKPKTLISHFTCHHRSPFSLHSLCLSSGKSVRTMSSSASSQRIFQLKLDPLTGNSEWVVIEDDDDDNDDIFTSSSKTNHLETTSYLDMLNDSYRNRAYRLAIDKTVTIPCHVLDIGAGTGLLSMMAARAMRVGDSAAVACPEGIIIACESYIPMLKLMRKVLRLNGMERKINVINKRSDELKVGVDINSRADILVSEILDSELLGEGLIPTLQHAHDTLLVENPKTVPCRATTYGQLVESEYLWKLHDLSNNEAKTSDDIHLVPKGLETVLCIKQQQYPMHCDALQQDLKLLSEPFRIFEFDFSKRPESHGERMVHIKATNDGNIHAIISWWVLQLDYEGTIFYSTAPKWVKLPLDTAELPTSLPSVGQWCDHWKQCVWFVPGKGMSVSKDEEVQMLAIHTDTHISYNLKAQAPEKEVLQYDFGQRNCNLILSPERVAIYGDCKWRLSMLTSLSNVLQGKDVSLCVVADDSVYLTVLVAHILQSTHVISLFPGLRDKGFQYLSAIADANGFSTDRVKVFEKRKACLTMQDTNGKQVDLLIGEPFYFGSDAMLPWQNLRFWKDRTMLDPILSKDVLVMPCKGLLKACAMSLPDLWNSRCCLKSIEGFDHSVVNASLGACGDLPLPQEGPYLPYHIWQCGETKELSQELLVMEFDFSNPISPCSGNAKFEFTAAGVCHGFALWIDWVMDAENSVVISTGPGKRYWKQGVKLLANPIKACIPGSTGGTDCCMGLIEASFDPSTGQLNVEHYFS